MKHLSQQDIKVHRWKCFSKIVKTSEKNVHGGNFTPWGWGTQNFCAKTGTDSGAGSCVIFRKSCYDENYETMRNVMIELGYISD